VLGGVLEENAYRRPVRSEIESYSETNGAGGRAEDFGDFIDTSTCQAVNAPDRR